MRMDFKTYLTEAGKSIQQSSDQRTHSEHVNHLAFDGHDAVAEAHEGLTKLHNFLTGKKTKIPKSLTTKVDGAPAFHVIKGKDGRIGLATKGLFNKNPKIAWNHEDITKHYGHAPGLEAIMHDLYDHAGKVLPKNMKPGEIYKGDALFGGDRQPETRDGHVSFMPNLLRYKYPKGSNEADRVQRAKVGVAFHTHYDSKGRASPITDEQREKFQSHPDVFNMDPRIQIDPQNYTPTERTEYNTHMENARREYQKLDPGAYDAMGHHNMDMRTYANDVVRRGTGESLSTEDYIKHLNAKHEKDIAKYKTQASVDKKMASHADKINEILRNKEHFDKIFKMHDHLQKAKNVLIGVLDKNNPAHVELPNGQPTVHEGYVDEAGRKYVQQGLGGFTQFNLSGAGRFQKPIKESLYEDIKIPENSEHVLLGRFQGVQRGHVNGVENAQAIADQEGSPFTVLTTHTHDKKNPLTPEQKMYYLKKAMPEGTNIAMTSKESPSLLHYATNAYNRGVRRLVVHAGSDRIDSYNKLLNSYKGVKGPHGFYGDNMQFEFRNMGEREAPDTSTPEKQKMIDAALHGDRNTYHSMLGDKMTPEQKDEHMNQTILQNSSGSLMKHASRIGDKKLARTIASPHMSDSDVYKMMRDLKSGEERFAKPKTPAKKPKFNPGTPVYVQHGSHSIEPVKESTLLSFRALTEAKAKISGLRALLDSPKYENAKADTVGNLESVNNHIAKGDSDNVHDVLSKHYSNNPLAEHFDDYSESSYPINSALFHHHEEGGDPKQLPDEDINGIEHYEIEGVDEALKVHKTPKPMTVFSGVGFNPGQMAAKHPEGNLYMPSFTSTSISPSVASKFAKPLTTGSEQDGYNPDADKAKQGADHHMLRINLPKGHAGSYIADSSYHPEEKEFLLPRQQTMKINPNPEVHEFDHNGVTHRMHVWDATPVAASNKPLKEETVSGGDMVRGMGDVSGTPSVADNPLQQYVDTNSLAKDNQNGAIMKMMKDSKHDMLGFKAFDPTKMNSRDKALTYWDTDENGDPLKGRRKK